LFGHESRTRHLLKCEIENLSKVFEGDSNPCQCCKIDLKQYKCSNLGIEPLTHVLWEKILVKNIIFNFFIPWWWVLSTMGLLLLLIMKLFIVYLGTIRLVEVHCTGVWEVYSCTIYQRLAFENMFVGEVYFTRPRKKRNSKSSILYY
jgi:hypothetical protein